MHTLAKNLDYLDVKRLDSDATRVAAARDRFWPKADLQLGSQTHYELM